MKAPQIIILVSYAINLLASAYMHGKPYKSPVSFWKYLLSSVIGILVLYWGGFFK
jgi:hypothetical protein